MTHIDSLSSVVLQKVKSSKESTLANIRSLIRLTQKNITLLNDNFASINPPPSDYLLEYEDLTTKLNDFQLKEEKLVDDIDELRKQIADLTKTNQADLVTPSSNCSSPLPSSLPYASTASQPLGKIRVGLPNSQHTVASARYA